MKHQSVVRIYGHDGLSKTIGTRDRRAVLAVNPDGTFVINIYDVWAGDLVETMVLALGPGCYAIQMMYEYD